MKKSIKIKFKYQSQRLEDLVLEIGIFSNYLKEFLTVGKLWSKIIILLHNMEKRSYYG